jgi:hypothetical protein
VRAPKYALQSTKEDQRAAPAVAVADRAIAQLPADAFFAQPAPGDNSVAHILKHVGGHLHSRWTDFLTTDGENPAATATA